MSQSINVKPDFANCSPDQSSLRTIPGLGPPNVVNSDSKMSRASSSRDTSPQPPPASSPAISDIERLEHLKKEILEGQNPIYKAIPQPSFLENLYMGRSIGRQSPTPAPAHPDQVDSRWCPSSDSSPPDAKSPAADRKRNGQDQQDEVAGADAQENIEDKAGLDVEQDEEQKNHGTNHVEGVTPAIPSVESKSTQLVGRHQSYSPGVPTQGATADAANLPQNVATDGRNGSSRRTIFTDSSIMTVHTFSDGFEVPHGPLSAPLTDDPPYDPKESLSHLKNASPWFDDRTSYVAGPYASGVSHPSYTLDNVGGRLRNSHYGYRFEGRPYEAGNHRGHFREFMPMTEPGDSNFRGLNGKESKADLTNLDASRLASSLSSSVFKSPATNATQTAEFTDAAPHPSTTDLSSGLNVTIIPDAPSTPHRNLSSTSGPLNARSAAPDVYQPFIEQPRSDVQITEKRIMNHRSSSSEGIACSRQTSGGLKRSLQERISDPSPPSVQEQNGNRMSLQERITSPPVDRSVLSVAPVTNRSGNRPSLEERLSSVPPVPDTRGTPNQEHAIPTGPTSVAMALSIIGRDQRITPVSAAASSAISPTSRTKVEDQHLPIPSTDVADCIDLLQPHLARSETPASVRGKAPDHQNEHRASSFDDSDAMLIPSPAYRDKQERHPIRERHSFAEAGHYERPLVRERDIAIDNRAGRPSLETREWRERDAYSRTFVPRADAPPSPARVWTANTRAGGPPEPHLDSGYYDREYDRRTGQPPHSWDREEVAPARPPPEVYPPIDDLDREWYPPAGARERPRIRGRSPSPNAMRRSTFDGREFRPAKRMRDEAYYECRDWRGHYYDRQMSPSADYYRLPDPCLPGDVRDPYHDRGYLHDMEYYERRPPDMGSTLPPHAGRDVYTRPDLGRYDATPRTT